MNTLLCNTDLEQRLLSVFMLDPEHLRDAQTSGVTADSFTEPRHRTLFNALVKAAAAYGTTDAYSVAQALDDNTRATGLELCNLDNLEGTSVRLKPYLRKLRDLQQRRHLSAAAERTLADAQDPTTDPGEIVAGLQERLERIAAPAGQAGLAQHLESCRVDYATPPERPTPVFSLTGKTISTAGNLTALYAQAKSGKTAVVGAMVAALIAADAGTAEDCDCLGITAAKPGGKPLLVFDTEQSRFDSWHTGNRAMRRAGVDTMPPWVITYTLTGWSATEARAAVALILGKHPTPFAIIIDGVADLAADPNDPKECNPLVAQLHDHAIKANCPLVAVIHRNEGEQSNTTARGHLGKQLMRKAESNVRIEARDGTSTLFAPLNRGGPIMEKDGICFAWNDEHAMHRTVARTNPKLGDLTDLAAEVFEGGRLLTWAEMRDAIVAARDVSKPTAERRITALSAEGLIRSAGGGKYASKS
jgi:hypothetical protein